MADIAFKNVRATRRKSKNTPSGKKNTKRREKKALEYQNFWGYVPLLFVVWGRIYRPPLSTPMETFVLFLDLVRRK